MAKKTVITEVQDVEVNEALIEFPQNRTLLIEHLTNDQPVEPEINTGLTTIEKVFDHFKPNLDIEFQDTEGAMVKETMNFRKLGDFGVNGILNQSPFLQKLNTDNNQFQAIIKQLKNNKTFRNTISNPESKKVLLNVIMGLIEELEEKK